MNSAQRVSTAGLVGLVVITTVLVGWALKSNGTTPPSPPAASSNSAADSVSPSSTPSLTPTPTPTATATGAATTSPSPLQTILVALDNKAAWRISVGSCANGGAKVAITTDGGTTWADAKTPLRTVVRVRPTDAHAAFVVGADTSFAAVLKTTSDAGTPWCSDSSVGNAWFRDPKKPAVVHSPGPASSTPCGQRAVLDLAVISVGSARVLCADGLVRSTTDTGSS